jgi:uncharacterized protein YfiM (DUF2279 family)
MKALIFSLLCLVSAFTLQAQFLMQPSLLSSTTENTISAPTNWQASSSSNPTLLKNISGPDKILHFSFSAIFTYAGYHLSREVWQNSHTESINIAICLTSSLGLTKEFTDNICKDTGFSWYDLSYDLAGISLGLIMINNLR